MTEEECDRFVSLAARFMGGCPPTEVEQREFWRLSELWAAEFVGALLSQARVDDSRS